MINKAIGNSFVFYESYLDSIKEITDINIQLEIFLLITNYGLYGNILDNVSETSKAIFQAHKYNIDYSIKRRKININNGLKGGAPKGSNNNPNGRRGKKTTNRELTENKPITKLNINNNEKCINDNGNIYRPPKYEELLTYAKSKDIPKSVLDSFYKHYQACNWLDKHGNPIEWELKLEWWFSQRKEKETNILPKYDDSKNINVSEEEKKELEKLMTNLRKEKDNYERNRF